MRVHILVIAALCLAFASFAPVASAQNDNNAGTVKVHDNAAENPPKKNVPHVSCDFWIEGFGMNDASGYLVFYAWPPTGDKQVVTPTGANLTWTADAEDGQGNFHFLLGPFFLPEGHYRVEVYTDDGHPGNEGQFAKTKTFWVEPCGVEVVNPPCPGGVAAAALPEGGVHLTWTGAADQTFVVYRAVGEGDFEFLTSVTGSSYTDTTTSTGVTYSYYVTNVVGDLESEECMVVTVTAVPFFGAPVLGALALAGAVLAYATFRRRA